MRLTRLASLLLALCLTASCAAGEGVTLHTVSGFYGSSTAAEAYLDILNAYEALTGNTVIDDSASADEAWKISVLSDFAAGNEPDVLFFFAGGADSATILNKVVPITEINAAYPIDPLPEVEAMREGDGNVYAVPTSSFWEGLFVNTDVFERCSAPLPTNWESFTEAIRIFNEKGVTPISVSLSDIPHYLAEAALLACATPEELAARPGTLEEIPDSWYRAMELIRELYQMHAFADNAVATYERAATDEFLNKRAAMQFDGNWLGRSIPPENMDTIRVFPVPLYGGTGASPCYIGGVSMGFYLTRRAWKSSRRDAAVGLLKVLTREDNLQRLGNTGISGTLLASAQEMAKGRTMISPLQDDMNQRARETWLLECIPALAAGDMTAADCWARVMSFKPFGE